MPQLDAITIEQCWQSYSTNHLPTTVKGRGNQVYWKWLAWFATLDAERLSPMEVEQYASHRAVDAGTLNRELSLLRACLRYAERNALISKAPIIKALPRPTPRLRALTKQEAQKLIKATEARTNWREEVFIKIALGTGARSGAISDLTWDRVDEVNGTLDFRVTGDKVARMKRRTVVPINHMVRYALGLARKHAKGPYVLHWNGRKMDRFDTMLRRLTKVARIKDCSPHVLRHTVASLLLQSGEDLLKVSRLLGHADSRITEQVYFQHSEKWLRDLVGKLRF